MAASWGAGPRKVEQSQLPTRARALDSTNFVVAAGQASLGSAGQRRVRERPNRGRPPRWRSHHAVRCWPNWARSPDSWSRAGPGEWSRPGARSRSSRTPESSFLAPRPWEDLAHVARRGPATVPVPGAGLVQAAGGPAQLCCCRPDWGAAACPRWWRPLVIFVMIGALVGTAERGPDGRPGRPEAVGHRSYPPTAR